MYTIAVKLKQSRSARLRNLLAKNGFAIYQIERLTLNFAPEKDDANLSEEELSIDDKTLHLNEDQFYYHCIYNGNKLSSEVQDILKKIEESQVVISYEITRSNP